MRWLNRSIPLVLALSACFALPATAQPGLRGGINLASLFGDDVETSPRTGLNLGLSVDALSLGPAQVVLEGYYRQKGARDFEEVSAQLAQGQSVEIGLDYVEVPVLLKIALPALGGRVTPYLMGGPAFAWRLDCGIEVGGVSGDTSPSCDDLMGENLEETLKDYETGWVVSGGLDIPVGGIGAITLDARLTQGLSRIAEAAGGAEVRSRTLSFMLGYSFAPSRGMGGPMMGR